MTTTVQVRQKGQFTIPVEMRENMGIQENDVVTVTMLGENAMVIIPQKLKTQALLEQVAQQAKKRGITLDAMLAELDEIRHNS